MTSRQREKQPDSTTPLLDTELIPEPDFKQKLRHIFAVSKEELDAHIAEHPDPPQKRGRKPKESK